jgi:signal transduction histidine kinase
MSAPTPTPPIRGLALAFHWHRLRFVLLTAFAFSLPLAIGWTGPYRVLLFRLTTMGLVALAAFGLFEQWPRTLPRWLARWVLQVVAVGLTIPITVYRLYALTNVAGQPTFWHDNERVSGFAMLCALGLLVAPWIALGALVRQKDALARQQALELELERSEVARQSTQARLNLLQAQVAPHFLFNTLANVQALVETGSPAAPQVLASLIAYLRAAVPRLDETETTLGTQLDLVRAYLDLMHMRMPDRLRYEIDVADDVRAQRCPPMTLQTLVENAVRHGIDPGEDGGTIRIEAFRDLGHCVVRVVDSGVGLAAAQVGLGTGLASLRERLALMFGDRARLNISAEAPHGVRAVIEMPLDGDRR